MLQLFSSEEIEKLVSILKLIMPVGNSGMPEAQYILNCIDLNNPTHIKFVEISKNLCNKISKNFIANDDDLNLLKKANFRDFSVFVNMVLILYYSNKTVLSKLNIGSVPPFPEGNFVKEGDIYLLEKVYLRGKIYKD